MTKLKNISKHFSCDDLDILLTKQRRRVLLRNAGRCSKVYPCFISLLYLDLYVLGDDTLIS